MINKNKQNRNTKHCKGKYIKHRHATYLEWISISTKWSDCLINLKIQQNHEV